MRQEQLCRPSRLPPEIGRQHLELPVTGGYTYEQPLSCQIKVPQLGLGQPTLEMQTPKMEGHETRLRSRGTCASSPPHAPKGQEGGLFSVIFTSPQDFHYSFHCPSDRRPPSLPRSFTPSTPSMSPHEPSLWSFRQAHDSKDGAHIPRVSRMLIPPASLLSYLLILPVSRSPHLRSAVPPTGE